MRDTQCRSAPVRPIQVDYLPTRFGGAWQSNYQISTGVVIRLGEKK